MKSRLITVLCSLFLLFHINLSSAAEVDAFFDAATNKLILPHLEVNGEIYYATLTLIDSNTLTFRTDLTSLVNVKAPTGQVINPTGSSIQGRWMVGSSTQDTIEFKSDGTYEQFQFTVSPGDSTCIRGAESGRYSWERSTGMLVARPTQDANRDCGFSEYGYSRRLIVDSTNRLRLIVSNASESDTYILTRVN